MEAIGHGRAEAGKTFQGAGAKKQVLDFRVIPKTSRFVGLFTAVAAASPLAGAQAGVRRAAPADIALRSAVSGIVRDADGRPQVGALVELLNAQYALVARTFTDDRGRYALPRVGGGTYQVKAISSLYLPTLHPGLRLLPDSRVIVNLTLSTLYQALQWLPAEPRRPDSTPDDWNWTLRLSANRPLLRALEPGTARRASANGVTGLNGPLLVEQPPAAAERSQKVLLRTGSTRFGEGAPSAQAVWTGGDGDRALLFAAETALAPGETARLSTTGAYRRQLTADRSVVTMATLTDRPSIEAGGRDNGLVTLRLRSGTTVQLGDLAEVSAGTELAYARLAGGGAAAGSHPYAQLAVRAGAATTVRCSVATARSMGDGGRREAEAAEAAPRRSEVGGTLRMEQGLHQELLLSRKVRSWTGELSVFEDAVAHPVLEGAVRGDEAALDPKDVLFDPGTGTIAVSGQGYRGGGVMGLLRDQLSPGTWLSFRYALGEAASLPSSIPPASPSAAIAEAVHAMTVKNTSMLAVAGETRVAATGTLLRGSYRWQPVSTLTGVDPFAAGIPDAYLGFSVRQPLHIHRADSGRVEAVLDVRNLLAQGYRPFLSQDGTTVYFTQEQRCIAGGVSFSF